MKLGVDSCSVILLAKATVLRSLCQWHEIVVTESVSAEVLAGEKKQTEDALIFKQLKEETLIKIGKTDGKPLEERFGLGKGEAETIALKLKDKTISAVLTDNRQGRKVAKVLNLDLLGSLEIIVAMYKKKLISKEKTLSAIAVLEENGWFSLELIEKAKEAVKNG